MSTQTKQNAFYRKEKEFKPNRLYSPHTTFLRQSGQSHELATALCSLLLGLGYDAYVVFGYATRDVALRIMTRVDSPYAPEETQLDDVDEGDVKKKYAMKAPRDLRSKFLLMMEQREIDKVKAEEERRTEVERRRIEEEEKPPFDELEGLRVHSWVLIRPGGRSVDDLVFVEPSTGMAHRLDSPNYTGIESIWNNLNYWVNMQDCSGGLASIDYDLSNVEKWEHLLMGEPASWRKTKVDINMEEEEAALAQIMEEKHLDMPTSWSMRISIPHAVLKNKYPDGANKTWYKRTLVEEFAPYVQYDGLVTKISRYQDFECTEMATIESLYENRTDKMLKQITDIASEVTVEYFDRGRDDAVKSHSYSNSCGPAGAKRTIIFYHEARYDGLSKIEVDDKRMVELYVDREDFMHHREVEYAAKGSPPPGVVEGLRRIILNVVEKSLRNEGILATEDLAVRRFQLIDRQIHLKYHFGEGKVTASTRTFIKPPLAEMGEGMKFNPDLTYGYQAEVGGKPPRQLQLFLLFERMLKEEEKSLAHIRQIEDEVTEFLSLRDRELAFPKLEVSLFNREQNENNRLAMLEREKQEQMYRERQIEDEIDYLAPYLAKLGITSLNRNEAQQVKNECLNELKNLLVARANDVQKQFEMWSSYIADRQRWYSSNQDSLKENERIRYFQELNDLTFLLQTLEIRLTRHKELSATRYQAMVRYLQNHPQLAALK